MISVIIPTYNGAHKVLKLLNSLEGQTFNDFETLVVIDGSTDKTLELLNNSNFRLKDFRIIFQKNKGRAAVRNRGAMEAKGDVLIFFDDDMRLESSCVAAHLDHHRSFPESISVGSVANDFKTAKTEMQKYKCYYSRKWEERLDGYVQKPLPEDKLYISAANFCLSKNLFMLLGGFDERLNDAEDHDFAIRAHLENIPVFYNRNALASHEEELTLVSYIQRRKAYNAAQRQLKVLKPEVFKVFDFRCFQRSGTIKPLFFWLFSFNFWIFLVDKFPVFSLFPQRIKFRLYDWVVTSKSLYFPNA